MGTNNFYKYQGSKSGNEETGFFNTKGRISRNAYLLRLLLVLGIYLVSCLLVYGEVYKEEDSFHQYVLPSLLIVFVLIQGAKRMHDVDRTGWAFLIPIYNVYLSLLPGTPGNNSFGVDPTPRATPQYFDELDAFQKNSSGSLGDDVPNTQATYSKQGSPFKLPVKQVLLFLLTGVLLLAVIFREDFFRGGEGNRGDSDPGNTEEQTGAVKNAAPTDISLSSYEVNENRNPGEQVGTFTATDANDDDSHTYALVSGQGDADNGSFAISGKSLTTTQKFDFESKNSFTIRVQVTDKSGATYVSSLTIQIRDDVSDNPKLEKPKPKGVDPTPPSKKTEKLFYCKGDGKPIKLDQVQNGFCDCPDKSDELPGTCK